MGLLCYVIVDTVNTQTNIEKKKKKFVKNNPKYKEAD